MEFCAIIRPTKARRGGIEMSHKRSLVTIIIILFCVSGCSSGSSQSAPVLYDVLQRNTETREEPPTETAGVYLDVTQSMKGFLTKPNDADKNRYSLFLHELGKLVAAEYGQLSYFRVDSPLWLVDGDEKVLEKGRYTDYYQESSSLRSRKNYTKIGEGSGYRSLCLTTALDYGVNQDLFILVTDFYENSIDNNVNADAILEKINELAGRDDGKVFGLIGVNATFSGTIYDTGTNGAAVKYGTKPGENVTRPFYIILRGYPNQVRDFCDHMTQRMETIGMQRGTDYEATVFYVDGFSGPDYTSLNECANRLSPNKDFVWPYATVTIRDAKSQGSTVEKNVYGYRKSAASEAEEDRILYFSYTINEEQRDVFHALISKSTERKTVNFLPEGEKELLVIPCAIRERRVAIWDGSAAFTAQDTSIKNGGEYFEVLNIYYDEAQEVLYAALRLKDRQFTEGIWRLQWESVLDHPAEEAAWWEDWHSKSGEEVDYSKTERLKEYVAPIIKKMPRETRSVLSGVIYLSVEETLKR